MYYSAVSVAEIQIKQMLGRLDVPTELTRLLAAQGLSQLPLSGDQADRLVDFPTLVRHDPFDRLLLAQAIHERMPFLTADSRLTALDLAWVLDATA